MDVCNEESTVDRGNIHKKTIVDQLRLDYLLNSHCSSIHPSSIMVPIIHPHNKSHSTNCSGFTTGIPWLSLLNPSRASALPTPLNDPLSIPGFDFAP